MQTAEQLEGYVLQEDGCYTDRHCIQHYLFPRELDEIEDPRELAAYEFVWHMNPEWQGQLEENGEVEINDAAIDAEVNKLMESGVTYQLFPRQTFAEYLCKDWDAVAYCEYRWYKLQA